MGNDLFFSFHSFIVLSCNSNLLNLTYARFLEISPKNNSKVTYIPKFSGRSSKSRSLVT